MPGLPQRLESMPALRHRLQDRQPPQPSLSSLSQPPGQLPTPASTQVSHLCVICTSDRDVPCSACEDNSTDGVDACNSDAVNIDICVQVYVVAALPAGQAGIRPRDSDLSDPVTAVCIHVP